MEMTVSQGSLTPFVRLLPDSSPTCAENGYFSPITDTADEIEIIDNVLHQLFMAEQHSET